MYNSPVSQGMVPKSSADVDERSRASAARVADRGTSVVLDDDFDYISAYVDDGRRQSQVVNGYGYGT
jgi:hypothetical protein